MPRKKSKSNMNFDVIFPIGLGFSFLNDSSTSEMVFISVKIEMSREEFKMTMAFLCQKLFYLKGYAYFHSFLSVMSNWYRWF